MKIKGGVIGLAIFLIISFILFFSAHICQSLSKSNSCSIFVIPFSIIANLMPFSREINYIISLVIFLGLFFVVGIILYNRYKKFKE